MKTKIIFTWISALVLVFGMNTFLPNTSYAQTQRKCISNEIIIPLVKAKTITSFAKIERMLNLKKGTKIFGQQLCQLNGQYVYFFKVVDTYGRTKKFARRAEDGAPYEGNLQN